MSLTIGRLLYTIKGFSVNRCCNSSVFSMMFQLSLMILLIFGFLGLYVVTSTWGVFTFLLYVFSKSTCEYLPALL